jgi:predicted glycosyltransferase
VAAGRLTGVEPVRAMFWVQHLLGTGHLERVRRVAEALSDRGAEVHFVTGGLPLPGRMPRDVRIVQLPPICVADESFKPLRDRFGQPIDEAFRRERVERLLAAFDAARPDVLVFETYPFGRRGLRFELEPLLDRVARARPRPRLLVSVRDILQREKVGGRDAEAWALADRLFDGVLVHGDPGFIRLEQSAPAAARARVPVHHTGFVTAPGAPPPRAPRDAQHEIVVSGGGGVAGLAVLQAAVDARPLSRWQALTWRVLVGPGVPQARFQELAAQAGEGLVVERHRRDFPDLLARARVSVSQAGYNTVMDLLRSGAPAVLVPFVGQGETEQHMRAERLEQLGRAQRVGEAGLSAAALAAAIDRAAEGPEPGPAGFSMNGAEASAALIAAAAGR